MNLRVGTAGWTIPRQYAGEFPSEGSHLQRYSRALQCVEINSSFHRPHRRSTWERWAASTPPHFRFSVKLPKAITHTARLNRAGGLLQAFFDEVDGLGDKLGPLLIQLPPSLHFNTSLARDFLSTLRELYTASAALEPRHATWFAASADRLLREFEVARVAADPAKASPAAAQPGGWPGLRYFRLHGSPRTYYSDYSQATLSSLARTLRDQPEPSGETWVIFDNTALGHATSNSLALASCLRL